MKILPKEYVYFLRNPTNGLVKIGTSRDLYGRIQALRAEHGAKLELIGYFHGGEIIENEMHKKFLHLNFQREWFHSTTELIDYATTRTLPLDQVKPAVRDAAGDDPLWAPMLAVLKAMTVAEIMKCTECSARTAANWQTGATTPNADNFASLMANSDEFADAVLDATGRRKGKMTFVQRRKLLEVIGEK